MRSNSSHHSFQDECFFSFNRQPSLLNIQQQKVCRSWIISHGRLLASCILWLCKFWYSIFIHWSPKVSLWHVGCLQGSLNFISGARTELARKCMLISVTKLMSWPMFHHELYFIHRHAVALPVDLPFYWIIIAARFPWLTQHLVREIREANMLPLKPWERKRSL